MPSMRGHAEVRHAPPLTRPPRPPARRDAAPCRPRDRGQVEGLPPLAVGAERALGDLLEIDLDAETVRISGCEPVAAQIKGKRNDKIQAEFPPGACPAAGGAVKLEAKLGSDCDAAKLKFKTAAKQTRKAVARRAGAVVAVLEEESAVSETIGPARQRESAAGRVHRAGARPGVPRGQRRGACGAARPTASSTAASTSVASGGCSASASASLGRVEATVHGEDPDCDSVRATATTQDGIRITPADGSLVPTTIEGRIARSISGAASPARAFTVLRGRIVGLAPLLLESGSGFSDSANVTISEPIRNGGTFHISFSAFSEGFPVSGGTVDVTASARWLGITRVLDQNGAQIFDYEICSNSGTDYRQAVP